MKYLSVIAVAAMLILSGCGKTVKNPDGTTTDKPSTKTIYAKWSDAVYKEKELKTYAATLSKAESVEFISEEDVTKEANGKTTTLSVVKVKLADGLEAYGKKDLFAKQAIVFIEDNVTCYVRPTLDSDEFCKIPKGKLGFVVEEMENGWKKVYLGELVINGQKKWVNQYWINSGISTDVNMIKDAKKFEKALSLFVKDAATAKKMLDELSQGTNILFSDLARAELAKMDQVEPSDDTGNAAPTEGN